MAQPILPELSLQNRLWCRDLMPPVNRRIVANALIKDAPGWKRAWPECINTKWLILEKRYKTYRWFSCTQLHPSGGGQVACNPPSQGTGWKDGEHQPGVRVSMPQP